MFTVEVGRGLVRELVLTEARQLLLEADVVAVDAGLEGVRHLLGVEFQGRGHARTGYMAGIGHAGRNPPRARLTVNQIAEVHRFQITRLIVGRIRIGDVLRNDFGAARQPRHFLGHHLHYRDAIEFHPYRSARDGGPMEPLRQALSEQFSENLS